MKGSLSGNEGWDWLYARHVGRVTSDAPDEWVVDCLRNILPQGLLLDIGCGTGRHFSEAARIGWRIVGIDASINALRFASRLSPYSLICGDVVRASPLAPHIADCVLCTDLLSVVAAPELLLAQLSQLTKPDARLVVTLQHVADESLWLSDSRVDNGDGTYSIEQDGIGFRFFSEAAAEQLFAEGMLRIDTMVRFERSDTPHLQRPSPHVHAYIGAVLVPQ